MSEKKSELALINEKVIALMQSGKYAKQSDGGLNNSVTVAITEVVPQAGYVIAEDGSLSINATTDDGEVIIATIVPPADPTVKGSKYVGEYVFGSIKSSIPQWSCQRYFNYAKGQRKGSKATSNTSALAQAFGLGSAATAPETVAA